MWKVKFNSNEKMQPVECRIMNCNYVVNIGRLSFYGCKPITRSKSSMISSSVHTTTHTTIDVHGQLNWRNIFQPENKKSSPSFKDVIPAMSWNIRISLEFDKVCGGYSSFLFWLPEVFAFFLLLDAAARFLSVFLSVFWFWWMKKHQTWTLTIIIF